MNGMRRQLMGLATAGALRYGRIVLLVALGSVLATPVPAGAHPARKATREEGRAAIKARADGSAGEARRAEIRRRILERRAAKRQRGQGRAGEAPTIQVEPTVSVLTGRELARVGETVTVTVRMTNSGGGGRHAAFHVGVDPAVLRFRGHRATGRGALLVRESAHPGEVVVYRSSLPEGFAGVEPLVILDFEVIAPGTSTVAIMDLRLLDRQARDLRVIHEATTIYVE